MPERDEEPEIALGRPSSLSPAVIAAGCMLGAIVMLLIGLAVRGAPRAALEYRGVVSGCQVYEDRRDGRMILVCPPLGGRHA